MAILRGLENLPQPRPWTHDLLAATLEELGAEVKHITLWPVKNKVAPKPVNKPGKKANKRA